MKRIAILGAIAALAAVAFSGAAHATGVTITVTSASDGGAATCPSAASCTLRKAIEAANADASGQPVLIAFSPTTFPAAAPATITVGGSPLPVIARAQVTIDASGAGVHIVGNSQTLATGVNGIASTGAGTVVRGLGLSHFSGACILLSGENSVVGGDANQHEGNVVGDCGVGIALHGVGSTATGNVVGFASTNDPGTVTTGILIAAATVTVGGTGDSSLANHVGNATAAIQVGEPGGPAFSGSVVSRNVVGRDVDSNPAPVTFGILIQPPTTLSLVQLNTIAYAGSGIAIPTSATGAQSSGNHFEQNTFQSLTGLAIDLGADGITNPNDDGDVDSGPNGLLNHPLLGRAVQSRVAGTAGGCGGCNVQLYLANHRPGSPNDYGSIPVPGATTTSDSAGAFAFDAPAVTPGQWVTTLVTDPSGNTSEFSPSTRVGSGVAQCGNITLQPGWNHAGYFGVEPFVLGSTFPTAGLGAGSVTAIYHLRDGTTAFDAWFANGSQGRSLNTLEPGEAYWFFTTAPITLSTGFSLSVPLPVQLQPGWNDVVYIGAGADVRDAFAGLTSNARGIYRWSTDAGGRWQAYGDAATPSWARDFTAAQECGTYEVYMSAAATLTPLQP